MKAKDLTKTQFEAACKRHGFRFTGWLGYYEIGGGLSVSVMNAGQTNREKLAYLIQQKNKHE